MTNKRGPRTAAELMEELAGDVQYQQSRDEIEAERLEKRREWRLAEEPLLADLSSVGIHVDSVWTLVNTRDPYPQAIPVLLDHLSRPYPDRIREGIARALAVPEAASGWDRLKATYENPTTGPDAKDGLAVALGVTATPETFDELLDLINDPRHGESRGLLLLGLRGVGPEGRAVLVRLVDDPVLGKGATQMLKRDRR